METFFLGFIDFVFYHRVSWYMQYWGICFFPLNIMLLRFVHSFLYLPLVYDIPLHDSIYLSVLSMGTWLWIPSYSDTMYTAHFCGLVSQLSRPYLLGSHCQFLCSHFWSPQPWLLDAMGQVHNASLLFSEGTRIMSHAAITQDWATHSSLTLNSSMPRLHVGKVGMGLSIFIRKLIRLHYSWFLN